MRPTHIASKFNLVVVFAASYSKTMFSVDATTNGPSRKTQDIGIDDNYYNGDKNRVDDNFNNPHGYNNYKEDFYEHEEILITEDDALSFKFDDFYDPPTGTPPQPTIAPTPLDTTFWKEVEALDNNVNLDGYDYNDYNKLPRPDNSFSFRIALGVVNMDDNKDDMKNIVNVATRAISTVLNNDEGIPFLVWDSLDIHNRKLTETPTFPKSFRGQGDPQERDAAFPFDARTNGREEEDEYLAKLTLDSASVAPGDHDWWIISATYTAWREVDLAPVKERRILWQIERICEHSILNAIEEQIYWAALGDQDLVIPGHQKVYFMDDKGIVDAKTVGDEYDVSSLYCPMNRPLEAEAEDFECPIQEPNISSAAAVGSRHTSLGWIPGSSMALGILWSFGMAITE